MNNLSLNTLFLVVLLIGTGCHERNTGDKGVVLAGLRQITNGHVANPPENTTEKCVNIEKSIIRWKGTKMMRTGKHEGTLNLKEGVLLFVSNKLVGGHIVSEMTSIRVTDIPPHETVPIRNLTSHLNSDFDTQKYPTSRFEITQVEYINDSLLNISGNMTIKDVTKNISISAYTSAEEESHYQFDAEFTIDRFDWNIGIDGSWLEKKLVDEEIELRINIQTR